MYYSAAQLTDKRCSKILGKLSALGHLKGSSDVIGVMSEVGFTPNALILTSKDVIFYESNGKLIIGVQKFPISSITGIQTDGAMIPKITLSVGGTNIIPLKLTVSSIDVGAFCEALESARGTTAAPASAVPDVAQQITQLHDLMVQGILTEEEFNQKKRLLLGI